jgi:hypothetical protein
MNVCQSVFTKKGAPPKLNARDRRILMGKA